VLGLHVGFIDTDLTRGIDAPKLAADFVVARTYEALASGASEVSVGEMTQQSSAACPPSPASISKPAEPRRSPP
jgi:hypothetical protein